MRREGTCAICLALLLSGTPAWALEGTDVFGKDPWEKLARRGVTLESAYVGDFLGNVHGGLRHQGTYLGKLTASLTFDLERAGLVPGGKVFVSALHTHGGENPSQQYIGDLQVADNIEAPDAMRLYEHWYEQNLFGEKLSLLAGVPGMDREFAVSETSSLFINSSFGVPPDISANTSVSIFPAVGPGARLKLKPAESLEFMTGLYDGDPTDGGKNRHGVRYRLCGHQGFFSISEAAYRHSQPWAGSLKFGGWVHTRDVDDVAATDENGNLHRHQKNFGFYTVLDQKVFREKDAEQGAAVFTQFGWAPDNRNTVDYYLGAGVSYTGLLPGREEDVLGVAAANAFLSGNLRRARDLEIAAYDAGGADGNPPGSALTANESALEVTYRVRAHDRIAVQPDYQIIFNPSGESGSETAHVLALRFEITY
ncbi:MAG: carbohydrate porin [Candidatus Omnitrophica bacterium]|nr:carbohydrate porin [Candidatus Omnitrophota bacterium]